MVTFGLTSTSFCGLFTCLVSFERRTARPKCIYDILKITVSGFLNWTLYFLHVSLWILSGKSCFLPQSKHMLIRLTGDDKLTRCKCDGLVTCPGCSMLLDLWQLQYASAPKLEKHLRTVLGCVELQSNKPVFFKCHSKAQINREGWIRKGIQHKVSAKSRIQITKISQGFNFIYVG